LVSAPSKSKEDADAFLLPGINLETYDPDKHKIISMASCTTNALAPVVKVVRENFGIKYGLFSTVHAYTNTQSLTDQPMKDRRDSWAATENLIPSSSGAAKALAFIWPGLADHRQSLPRAGQDRQHRRAESADREAGHGRERQQRLPRGGG
jgi:glyceraldehyde 3-phosphate dehydrogenase